MMRPDAPVAAFVWVATVHMREQAAALVLIVEQPLKLPAISSPRIQLLKHFDARIRALNETLHKPTRNKLPPFNSKS